MNRRRQRRGIESWMGGVDRGGNQGYIWKLRWNRNGSGRVRLEQEKE